MSLKSVTVTGKLVDKPYVDGDKTTLRLVVSGGKKYEDIRFVVDCYGPIGSKTARDLSEGDTITVEGTARNPYVVSVTEVWNYLYADKVHYNSTKKFNEVYKPQQELFKVLGE